MNIQKQSFLYEVLIRGAADGTLAGAHQIRVERVVDGDTGEVLNERMGPATPLDVKDVGAVVGEAFAALATEHDATKNALDVALQQIEQLQAAAGSGSRAAEGRVSDLQFRLALNASGLREAAEAYVEAAGQDVKDWWDRSVTIDRKSSMIEAARVAMGRSAAEMDALFALARSV